MKPMIEQLQLLTEGPEREVFVSLLPVLSPHHVLLCQLSVYVSGVAIQYHLSCREAWRSGVCVEWSSRVCVVLLLIYLSSVVMLIYACCTVYS